MAVRAVQQQVFLRTNQWVTGPRPKILLIPTPQHRQCLQRSRRTKTKLHGTPILLTIHEFPEPKYKFALSSAGEGLPPPPYDINLPSFPTMSGGPPQSLPQLAPSQQQQQQQQQRNNRHNSKINSRLHHSRINLLNINSS